MHLINSALVLILKTVRPLLGPAVCLYKPSCSDFAYEQLHKNSFSVAFVAIVRRLISCNSFTK